MKSIIDYGNALAGLPLLARVAVGLLLFILVAVFLSYMWGIRPHSLRKLIQAEFPKSWDPRKWLLYASNLGRKGKVATTVLVAVLAAVLLIPMLFPNSPVVIKLLGRNQFRAVSSHLFIEHYQSYNYLYLQAIAPRNYLQVEDSLTFQNVTDTPLTHFRILTFLFTDFAHPSDFYHYYSINTGTQYMSLGVFDVGSLKSQDSYTLKIRDLYTRALQSADVTENQLNALLFPKLGEPFACDYKKAQEKSNQAFSRNTTLYGHFVVPHFKFGNVNLDAFCGLPIKLILNYHAGTSQFSSVLLGGTYYYGRFKGDKFVAYPDSVASFIKPRFSLVREKSGAEDEVVNMDVEIPSRNFRPIPYRHDPEILAWYSVVEPEGDEQLDQQVALTHDTGFEARQIARARFALEAGQVEEAKRTLEGLVTLSPSNKQAQELRMQLNALPPAGH